jgi:GGDEF domain-containing protein
VANTDLRLLVDTFQSGSTHTVSSLANRYRFEAMMGDLLQDKAADGSDKRGVLFYDVVKFKQINDKIGFSEGDTTLSIIGRQLAAHARTVNGHREHDIVLRVPGKSAEGLGHGFHLAGDEFIVAAGGIESRSHLLSAGQRLASATLLSPAMKQHTERLSTLTEDRVLQLGLRAGAVMLDECFEHAATPAGRLAYAMDHMDPKTNKAFEIVATYAPTGYPLLQHTYPLPEQLALFDSAAATQSAAETTEQLDFTF